MATYLVFESAVHYIKIFKKSAREFEKRQILPISTFLVDWKAVHSDWKSTDSFLYQRVTATPESHRHTGNFGEVPENCTVQSLLQVHVGLTRRHLAHTVNLFVL
jgi:hypothetical protein